MDDRLMVSVSGVRGTVGASLTPQVALDFGCAFGSMLGAGSAVVIGRDSRPSGPAIGSAVTAGLLACGVNVLELGIASTPGIALMTSTLSTDGGVVITASHNPEQYNGIKFLQPSGTGLTAARAGELKEIRQRGEFKFADSLTQGQLSQNTSANETHVKAVCDICNISNISTIQAVSAANFKVVVDSVNGAGCVETPMLLESLGCRMVHLNGKPTGLFAHRPEPIAENVTELCKVVKDQGAAVGFAQDADADRLAIVDEKGNFIGEEYTLTLAAAFMLSHRKGAVATNLVTSRMIDDIASSAGCEVIRTATGEANVVEGLLQNECIMGGEGGGGVIYPPVVPVRDSLVGMAFILQYLAETGKPLSELVAQIPSYVMIKTKIPCRADDSAKVITAVRKDFSSQGDAVFNDTDGLRIDLPQGWVSVRPSNTEPIMRITAEAAEAADAESLVERVGGIAEKTVKM